MELTLELAEKVLASQPFSVLLGTRLVAFGDGGAVLELDVRDGLRQQNGYLHGESWPTPLTTRSPSRAVPRSDRPC